MLFGWDRGRGGAKTGPRWGRGEGESGVGQDELVGIRGGFGVVLGWMSGVGAGWKRLWGCGSWAYGGGAECRVERCVVDPLMWLLSSTPSTFLGKGLNGAHRRPLC
ncbi:hypothetical protein GCM10017744_051050 [Streptomyces antimycoticus]|uniref:Uncharacterized protein n=1 Tax=Streptomyces antimycoticus TaxID=68175 RepID=A0A4D4K7P5_9ACTN|nr:hypothetical protein SANT12839_051240 [Streptomyces antimycoticus]